MLFLGNAANLHFYLNNYTDISSLSAAVQGIPYCGGNTNTTGGLRVMRTQIFNAAMGDRPDVPNLCILITDGNPTREVDILPAEVQMDKDAGIRILGVGVTEQVCERKRYTGIIHCKTLCVVISNYIFR